MVLPDDIDRHLEGEFLHSECTSCCLAPLSCAFCCLFPPWGVCIQRQRILHITGEPYICCGGLTACCGCDFKCPKICALFEAMFCMSFAMAANHFYVQTRFGLKNTRTDRCLQCQHCFVSVPLSCCRACCEVSKESENLLKSAICAVPLTHCMNAVELREYTLGHKHYTGPPAGIVGELPRLFERVGVVSKIATAPVQMNPMQL